MTAAATVELPILVAKVAVAAANDEVPIAKPSVELVSTPSPAAAVSGPCTTPFADFHTQTLGLGSPAVAVQTCDPRHPRPGCPCVDELMLKMELLFDRLLLKTPENSLATRVQELEHLADDRLRPKDILPLLKTINQCNADVTGVTHQFSELSHQFSVILAMGSSPPQSALAAAAELQSDEVPLEEVGSGYCAGSSCDTDVSTTLPCKFFDTMKGCRFGSACRFRHSAGGGLGLSENRFACATVPPPWLAIPQSDGPPRATRGRTSCHETSFVQARAGMVSTQVANAVAEQPAVPEQILSLGDVVLVFGLSKSPQYNERLGLILSVEACGERLAVRFAPDVPPVKVRATNLMSFPPCPRCSAEVGARTYCPVCDFGLFSDGGLVPLPRSSAALAAQVPTTSPVTM
jgi:hypothetical protein